MNQLGGIVATLSGPLRGARGRVFRTRLPHMLTHCSGKLRLTVRNSSFSRLQFNTATTRPM
jgi:hypothetical protein